MASPPSLSIINNIDWFIFRDAFIDRPDQNHNKLHLIKWQLGFKCKYLVSNLYLYWDPLRHVSLLKELVVLNILVFILMKLAIFGLKVS